MSWHPRRLRRVPVKCWKPAGTVECLACGGRRFFRSALSEPWCKGLTFVDRTCNSILTCPIQSSESARSEHFSFSWGFPLSWVRVVGSRGLSNQFCDTSWNPLFTWLVFGAGPFGCITEVDSISISHSPVRQPCREFKAALLALPTFQTSDRCRFAQNLRGLRLQGRRWFWLGRSAWKRLKPQIRASNGA